MGLLGRFVERADVRWHYPGSSAAGDEPLWELFSQVAVPVAGQLTRGAFLGGWRLMAIDGFEWDAPDSRENVESFWVRLAGGTDRAAFPRSGSYRQRVRLPRCRTSMVLSDDTAPDLTAGRAGRFLARDGVPLAPGWT